MGIPETDLNKRNQHSNGMNVSKESEKAMREENSNAQKMSSATTSKGDDAMMG